MNVLGETLTGCSTDPLTGFYRDGACNTGSGDAGAAPPVVLSATHIMALEFVTLDELKACALDEAQ